MKSKIVVLLIATILISVFLGCIFYKEPINEATIEDVQAIDGIGETLSHRIVNYIQNNPEADIDDLINVLGIGEKRVKLLKGKFKWI